MSTPSSPSSAAVVASSSATTTVRLVVEGQSKPVDVTLPSTNIVTQVKRYVNKQFGIPSYMQRIQLQSEVDRFQLPSTVIVTKRKQRQPSITIYFYSANDSQLSPPTVTSPTKFQLQVDLNDTILDIKFLISQQVRSEPEYQRLYFRPPSAPCRMLLEDHHTIQHYQIVNNSIVVYMYEYPAAMSTSASLSPSLQGHGTIHRTVPMGDDNFTLSYTKEVDSLASNFRYASKLYPNRRFLGTRTYIYNTVTNKDNKQQQQTITRGPYQWLTYQQVEYRVDCLSKSFRSIGLTKNDCIGIMSINRQEWVIADLALAVQSMITVPLYDTLGPDAVQYIINHANCKMVIVSIQQLPQILKAVKHKPVGTNNVQPITMENGELNYCPSLKHIVIMDDAPHEQEYVKLNQSKGLFHYSISQLEQIGKTLLNDTRYVDVLPSPNDLSTICYTSGTTGNPKGALLTHRSILSAASAIAQRMPTDLQESDDCMLSYLPLAHIYERVVETCLVTRGMGIGFFQGDTLKLVEDVQALKPSMFPGVPRIWQRVYDRVTSQVAESGYLKRTLFHKALSSKLEMLRRGTMTMDTIYDKVVFSKIASLFGGKVRVISSGAAPLSAKIAEFMRIAFQTNFSEGYGLTESCAGCTTTLLTDTIYGIAGMPLGCCEVKLVDVPDMEYLTTDPNPRGEIWIRGPNIFSGYYKQADVTNEVLGNDGWFQTGDIGMWLPDGNLKIIDRKKNLFKLSQGEYIRPEHIEGIYKHCKTIGNIYVHGDSQQNYLVAIIVPDLELLKQVMASQSLANIPTTLQQAVADARVKQIIMKEMDDVAHQEQLRGFEVVKKIVLTAEDFTVENGLLTPSFKLKRHGVQKKYQSLIDALYKEPEPNHATPIKSKL